MADEPFKVTDPEMLRAFAHPVRQRIMWELGVRDHARATDLARATGIPANSMSFHLRALAKAGLIVEAEQHARDARDRVWTMVHNSLSFEAESGDPGVDGFIGGLVDWARQRLLAGDDTDSGTGLVSAALLTKAEAKELRDEIEKIINRYRKHGADEARRNPDDPERAFQTILYLSGEQGVTTMPVDAAAAEAPVTAHRRAAS